MTDQEKKLMYLGQSVLNILSREGWEKNFLDKVLCNALDLGLVECDGDGNIEPIKS